MTDDLAGQIRRDLYVVKDNYDESLTPVRRAAGSPVLGSKEAPLPVSAHILDVRMEAHADLMYWTRFILEEVRDINGQSLQHGPASSDVKVLVPFVCIWVSWLITNMPDDADNLAADASRHANALRSLVHETGARRFFIGKCIEHGTSDLGERAPCLGDLRAVLRKDEDLLPSEITCSLDPEHRWPAREWMLLGRRIIVQESA